jgi:hypothetical protein
MTDDDRPTPETDHPEAEDASEPSPVVRGNPADVASDPGNRTEPTGVRQADENRDADPPA